MARGTMTSMRRTAVIVVSCVLVAAGLATAGGLAPPAAAMPHGTPVFLVGDSTMLGMAYGSSTTDARSIVAASYSLTYDAASCRRVLAPSCRGHGVIPLSVVPTMQQYNGRLGSVVVVMAGYDDIDISAGVDAVLAEAARQGVQRVLWLDYPTNVPYHQPLSSANVAPIYQRHNAVLAAKAAANPMLAIAPWAEYSAGHPEWFQPDGIHLGFPPGADELARFIVAQLEALPPPRCTGPLAGDPVDAPAVVPAVKLAPGEAGARIAARPHPRHARRRRRRLHDARRCRPVAADPPRRHGRDLRRREPHRRRPVRRRLPHRLPVRRAGAAGVERELRRPRRVVGAGDGPARR